MRHRSEQSLAGTLRSSRQTLRRSSRGQTRPRIRAPVTWQRLVSTCVMQVGVALVVLLDQLTRNAFRNQAQAFALDPHARAATRAVFKHPRYNLLRPVEVGASNYC